MEMEKVSWHDSLFITLSFFASPTVLSCRHPKRSSVPQRATSRKIVSAVVSHWLRAVPVADVGPSLPPSTEPRAARVEEGRAGPQDAERRGGGQGLENGNARGTPLVAGVKRDAPEGVVGVTPAAGKNVECVGDRLQLCGTRMSRA